MSEVYDKYLVVSKDGKWFLTGKTYFSTKRELALTVTEDEAKDLVSTITVMELELERAA